MRSLSKSFFLLRSLGSATFNILYTPMSKFVVIDVLPPTTRCKFTISSSLPAITETRILFTASNLFLVALSSAARDPPSVFYTNCSLIISRSLFTLLINSAILILSAVFFFFISCCFKFSLQVCNSFFRLMLYYIYFPFEIIILNMKLTGETVQFFLKVIIIN